MLKKKIALIIASDILGGHEFQSAVLAKSMSQHSEVVVFLNRSHLYPTFKSIKYQSRTHEKLFFAPGNIVKQIIRGILHQRQIVKVLSGFDEVIVCAGTVEASVSTGIACRLNHIPAFLYIPFFFDRKVVWGFLGSIYNFLLRLLVNIYPKLITINKIQALLLGQFYLGKTFVVRNSVADIPLLNLKPAAPRLVFIGRLDKQKRILELVQALDFADNRYKKFLVIGDGPLREKLLIAIRNVKYINVEYLGWLTTADQVSVLRPSDILVLNSIIEGEPMVLQEAAARGMISIVKNIPGVRGVSNKKLRFRDINQLKELLCKPISFYVTRSLINQAKKNSLREKQIKKIFR